MFVDLASDDDGFVKAESSGGPSINDFMQINHIFGPPLPLCYCPIHATYQYYYYVFGNPL